MRAPVLRVKVLIDLIAVGEKQRGADNPFLSMPHAVGSITGITRRSHTARMLQQWDVYARMQRGKCLKGLLYTVGGFASKVATSLSP